MLTFIMALRGMRKGFKKARATKLLNAENLAAIDRNARAYGYEIGKGAPLMEIVLSSPGNPFTNPGWKDGVINNGTP